MRMMWLKWDAEERTVQLKFKSKTLNFCDVTYIFCYVTVEYLIQLLNRGAKELFIFRKLESMRLQAKVKFTGIQPQPTSMAFLPRRLYFQRFERNMSE